MDSIELSIIEGNNESEVLKNLGVKANIISFSWDTYWKDILNIALYKFGADISQVGAPSTGGVISMNALRAFTPQEIKSLGGSEAFLPVSWKTTQMPNDPSIWAIPWEADVRVIYYWRDMLAKAKIDADMAFASPDKLENTMETLQMSGIKTPWAVFASTPFATLHAVCMWVWAAGGQLMNGYQIVLNSPEAMNGLKAFFRLKKYMPVYAYQPKSGTNLNDAFARREIAAICASPTFLTSMRSKLQAQPNLLKNLSVALPPGPAYVGGSNWIVWNHTRKEKEIIELVKTLTSKNFQLNFCKQTGYLPTRLDVFDEAPYSTDPAYRTMVQALKSGRSFPNLPRWGLVEDRLSALFLQIWRILYENPDQNSDDLLERTLNALINRLNMTLAEFG